MTEATNTDLQIYLSRAERLNRDRWLSKSDWTQLADSQLSAAQKAAWAAYRQALRDVTSQAGFPFDIQWPVAPQ